MLNPGGKVYRGTVVTSSPYTGEVSVLLSGFGVTDSVITISNVSRRMVSNRWTVPTIGEQVYVTGDDEDLTNAFLLTANNDSDTATGEPMGHEDKTKSTVAFNATTRTFTIAPVGVEHAVWCMGRRIVKRAAESLTLPNTTGSYVIFYDQNGFLNYQLDRFTLSEQTPTAYVYWNATTQRAEIFADERHGIVLDWQTHEYLHRTRGASFANGFDAYNFTTAGTGSANTDAQVSIANGTFFDEDLEIAITHSATPTANTWQQRLQGPAYIPCFYRSGTEWRRDTATLYPLKSGATLPVYNSYSAPNWGVTELGNNKYGITWVVATNNLSEPVMGIVGQAEYNNLGDAEAVLWTSMNLTSLPVHEMRPLYKVVYQVAGAYTNTPKAAIRGVYDIRIATTTAGTSSPTLVIDHGSLTGLADDDHPQYYNQARGDGRYLQLTGGTLTGTGGTPWSTAGWVPSLRAAGAVLLQPTGANTQRWLIGNAGDGNLYIGRNTASDNSQAADYRMYMVWNGPVVINPSLTVSGGTMTMNNAVANHMVFGNVGVSPPTLNTRSTGTRLVLWGGVGPTNVEYAIGIDGGTQWFSVPTTAERFRWYAGTSEVVRLEGNGQLSIFGQGGVNGGGGGLVINNSSPTIWLADTDNRSGMIHMNSNIMYFLRGAGANTLSWQALNNAWPLTLNMENNTATFGGTLVVPGGHWITNDQYGILLASGWTGNFTVRVGEYYGQAGIVNANGTHLHIGGQGRVRIRGGAADPSTATGNYDNAFSVYGDLTIETPGYARFGRAAGTQWYESTLRLDPANAVGACTAAVSFHVSGTAPQIRVGTNTDIFNFRNAWDTGWATVAAVISNQSSREWKQDIAPWPATARSAGAAASEDFGTEPVQDVISALRPVFYRWREREHLAQIPAGRRGNALVRLNRIRAERGLAPWDGPDLVHQCGRDCDGTPDDPCHRVVNWRKGFVGFVAEEVGEVFPEGAHFSEHNRFTGLDPTAFSALLVAAMQEVYQRLEALEAT